MSIKTTSELGPSGLATEPVTEPVSTSMSAPANASADAMASAHERRSVRTAELLALARDADPVTRKVLLDEVVTINLRVSRAIARRFNGRGIPLDDLEQVAAMALVRAAAKFDPGMDRDFLSYAIPTMSGEAKRHFRDHGWSVRPPRRIQEIHLRVSHAAAAGRADGTPITAAEIAEQLDLPLVDVEEALLARGCFTPTSLDQPAGTSEDGGERESIGDMFAVDDTAAHQAADARAVLQPVLRQLSERDRRILTLRFVHEQTQRQIGDELGVTQMQISRRLEKIMRNLRNQLVEDDTTPPVRDGSTS